MQIKVNLLIIWKYMKDMKIMMYHKQELCRVFTFQISHIQISVHTAPKDLLAVTVTLSM